MNKVETPFQTLAALSRSVINDLKVKFTSHEFIELLFKNHQREFIEALYEHRDGPAPMRQVTSQLSRQLHNQKSLECIGRKISSANIFSEDSECAVWRKR